MSRYEELVCPPCRVRLWLGKAIATPDGGISHFHRGPAELAPNSERPELTKALWRFLADHAGHPLRVVSDSDHDYDTVAGFAEIGGDEIGDIGLDDYVRDFRG